jgi:hypothetical protein
MNENPTPREWIVAAVGGLIGFGIFYGLNLVIRFL